MCSSGSGVDGCRCGSGGGGERRWLWWSSGLLHSFLQNFEEEWVLLEGGYSYSSPAGYTFTLTLFTIYKYIFVLKTF